MSVVPLLPRTASSDVFVFSLSLPASDLPVANAESTPSSAPAVPVGAANAGINPLGSTNGASAIYKLSDSALVFTAIAAVLAVAF